MRMTIKIMAIAACAAALLAGTGGAQILPQNPGVILPPVSAIPNDAIGAVQIGRAHV